ncbi:MAG TPA: HisA/HisF-related TIM barrel protein [Planctomycetaceae bacterium]|nr:HisA/HisF-related TIM barrel protein [Planctomycetaceae bacterium]
MRIVPVLDLLDGLVVRGVAGRRDEYRPVASILTGTPTPHAVARAFRERLGLDTLYVADLDAILHDRPNVLLYRELIGDGFELLVDAGVRDAERIRAVLDAGAAAAVVGLETLPDAALLEQAIADHGAERIIFSLDLASGRPLGATSAWRTDDAFEIAADAFARGVRRMIVLDLAAVGVGAGVPTIPLCRRLRDAFPELRLITGGGIRGPADLEELAPLGLEGVLVASALHDGRLTRTHAALQTINPR